MLIPCLFFKCPLLWKKVQLSCQYSVISKLTFFSLMKGPSPASSGFVSMFICKGRVLRDIYWYVLVKMVTYWASNQKIKPQYIIQLWSRVLNNFETQDVNCTSQRPGAFFGLGMANDNVPQLMLHSSWAYTLPSNLNTQEVHIQSVDANKVLLTSLPQALKPFSSLREFIA